MRVGRMARICASTGAGSIAPGALRSASGITLVTPEARFASRKIGSVHRSISPGASARLSTSARCCAIRNPCVRTAAFGSPVEPLVNVMIAGVSGSQGSTPPAASETRRAIAAAPGTPPPIAALMGIGANRRGCQAQPVGPGHGDEGVGADAGDAAVEPLAPGRWIDEHRRRPQPEQRDHRRVERDRHRAEDERAHARPDAGARQIARPPTPAARSSSREGDAAPPLDDGVTIADSAGPAPRERSAMFISGASKTARNA